MKKLLLLFIVPVFLYSCGSTEESGESDVTDSTEVAGRYTYTSSFEMADPSLQEIIKDWNNAIVAGDIDRAVSLLADSVEITLADGAYFNTTKDSVQRIIEGYLESLSNIEVEFAAGLSVISDQGDQWVLSYTEESFESEEGEVEMIIHEGYRIVDGKIRTVFQYSQVPVDDDDDDEDEEGDDDDEEYQDGDYLYSGSFEMGDPGNVDIVNQWIDAFIAKDFSSVSGLFQDSVSIIFADGNYYNGPIDSLLSDATAYFEGAEIEIEFVAAMSVRSTVQNDDWVLSWTDETYSWADSTQRQILHEAYLIRDGKISFVRQFSRESSARDE